MYFISFIIIYHFLIQNPIEKIFSNIYFNKSIVNRPNGNLYGMPSGHVEITSLFLFLLYFYGFISILVSLCGIIFMSLQRVLCNMHTIFQTIIGALLGFIYAFIYYRYQVYGIICVILFAIILLFMIKYQF
jgi:membrane-associated phospholipid phosphatase